MAELLLLRGLYRIPRNAMHSRCANVDMQVLFISIHADPDLEFPYFSGRAEETGHADGRGFNLNIPLPVDISLSSSSPPSLPGSSCASSPEAATAAAAKAVAGRKPGGHGVSEARYLDALDTAISAITTFAPDVLAVSAGFDGFLADQVEADCLLLLLSSSSFFLLHDSHCSLPVVSRRMLTVSASV